MNQQPDKLFRDKLEGYHKQPSAAAWDRIEAGTTTNKKPFIWMRVAAALLVLAVAAFLLWPRGSADTAPDATAKKIIAPEIQKQEEEVKQAVPDENAQPLMAEKKTKNGKKASDQKKKRVTDHRAPETNTYKEEETLPEQKPLPVIEEEISNQPEVAVVVPEKKSTVAASQETFVSLVITAEEANDKYLDKEALAEATSRKKNASTFKKLLVKAYDLKNNQDPFGDLRQKKNEILALNFKNDKQRGQNK